MKMRKLIVVISAVAFPTGIIGLTTAAAMNVNEAIVVLQTTKPASAVAQTIRVDRKTIDVSLSRSGLEMIAHAEFANLDEDHIVYQGVSTKSRRSFAFLAIHCKRKKQCVEVTADGKWNIEALPIETNTFDADKVKDAIRTLIRLNQ